MPNLTLKALYQSITGDDQTHQRTIDKHFGKLDDRRKRVIKARLQKLSLSQIAEKEGVKPASISAMIAGAIERIRKAIHQEPRYNRRGRNTPPQTKAGQWVRSCGAWQWRPTPAQHDEPRKGRKR